MRMRAPPTSSPVRSTCEVRLEVDDLRKLDVNGSGHLTAEDLTGKTAKHIRGHGPNGAIDLAIGPKTIGLGARLFEIAKQAPKGAKEISIPCSTLSEAAPDRVLLACDSYAANLRSMRIPEILDALLQHPDPKLGTLSGGLRDDSGKMRSYGVVEGGKVVQRTASYGGEKIHLYVPKTEPEELAALQKAVASSPKYANIEVHGISKSELADHEERMKLKYDRPGVFWVSSKCPVLPNLDDPGYIVPGGRFGIELYYHDTRINLPSARNTVEELVKKGDRRSAEQVLSAMRGTTNSLCNEVLHYGKIFNATLSVNAGRSQAPCLTNGALETYRAWVALHPDQKADAKKWLRWAADAARQEYETVWTSGPRFDPLTGLSRYVDESPSIAPEEEPHFYQGIEWSADDIASDAAIREHGWDSMPASIVLSGPDKGKPRVHQLLPVCLNSLLYRYEKDLASIERELGGSEREARSWEARADKRKETMDRLMWNEEAGLYFDLYRQPGTDEVRQNPNEDLRSFTPLWAGIVDPKSARAKKLSRRIEDFERPGGLATATERSWDQLHDLNPAYTTRCQWGHKDIGWPISTYETVKGLRSIGEDRKANEIAYRWCLMVQNVMDSHGGLHFAQQGGFEAPVFEKMDVTLKSPGGAATIGYGNQGAGVEGEGSGFRWGYDAYKLLYRDLPEDLRAHLRRGTDAEVLFDARMQLLRRAG
jgi:alpha,alpha-trehalase